MATEPAGACGTNRRIRLRSNSGHWNLDGHDPSDQGAFALHLLRTFLLTSYKVDADGIIDRGKVASVREATGQLQEVLDEWSTSGTIPEVDWSKLRALEIQDVVQARNTAAQSLSLKSCRLCSEFGEHVSVELWGCGLRY